MTASSTRIFFAHETDLTTLEQTLGCLYGIHFDSLQGPSNLKEIYEHALTLCCKLGANEQTFFRDARKGIQFYLLDYLVTDALFHVRKELSQENTHRSLSKFLDEISKHSASGVIDSSNFSRYMKKDFMSSLYPSFLGISSNCPNSNYRLPMFMDRLLFFLITSVKKSPYRQDTSSTMSFSMLNTFFVKGDICAKICSAYHDDAGNQCIATYLSNRLFDIDTMVYIINKLRNKKFFFTHEAILPYLLPIFFVPNTFGKRAYCDLMFEMLSSNREICTPFDHWNRPSGEIAYIKPDKTAPQIEEANFVKCRQYLVFLSSTYLPLLSACFYVLLRKSSSSLADMDTVLMRYLSESNLQSKAEALEMDWKTKLRQFDSKEKALFAQLYQQIRDTLSDGDRLQQWRTLTSLNYISANSPYQKAILETVLKERFGTHNRNVANFITFSKDGS